MIVGRTYLERGKPVVVLVGWRAARRSDPTVSGVVWMSPPSPAPRNVLIERADGSRAVRPFRGLRKPKPKTSTTSRQN